MRPTREGIWFLVLLAGVTLAAFNTGNNLLYLLLSALLSLLVLQNLLAEWNLRGLRVERRLPEEVFAWEGASGALVLCNRRRALASVGVEVEELDGGEARCVFGTAPPGEEVSGPASWTFGQRGWVRLGRVRIRSTYPFGFFVRYREFELPAELLVYPARRGGARASGASGWGREAEDPRRRGSGSDFLGLRAYVAGDSVRRIHWPSSARVGRPVVVERTAERAAQVVVRAGDDPGRVEQELAQACGQAVRGFSQGLAVGLELPGRSLSPGRGRAHRQRLLTALALHAADEVERAS